MRCIFCKESSDDQKSWEHIIPESLGNKEHLLPPGWVCDKCNNYLSREVEAPFLNSEYGRRSRFEMAIPSKKGRIPIVTGFHPQSGSFIDFIHDGQNISFCASKTNDEERLIHSLRTHTYGSFYILPAGEPTLSYELARFIGMLALEAFAARCLNVPGSNDEIVDKEELDELRFYVRRGRKGFIWPIHMRRIYRPGQVFTDLIDPQFQVLHEWDILFIPEGNRNDYGEVYLVIAILGVEYVINLGGPELEGYERWLDENQGQSYLYFKKEK